MSKLSVDQKRIEDFFIDKSSDFLIPDYQRPYAWGIDECQILWEDILAFAFPNGTYDKFDEESEEYYLGTIVTFRNENKKLEVIDGQQRLTTLMLLLRAFYDRFKTMQDEKSKLIRERIEKCIWKTDIFGKPDKNILKINSEVASDEDKVEFLSILSTSNVTNAMKSKYAINFMYFQEQIDKFISDYPSYFSYLPARILNNCILLPIEAESQNTALRIFSTLNDRGKPLSDSDIFKAKLYKFYSDKNEKDMFIEQWKYAEEKSNEIFDASKNSSMDELFAKYMYYERAKQEIKSTTSEALRTFYEKNNYSLFQREDIFPNLIKLVDFWHDIANSNIDRFENESILKKLFILEYAPNGMWSYFVSVYYLQNKDNWNNEKFERFLDKTIAFIWMYTLVNPSLNSLRIPIYNEMVNIVKNKEITFSNFKFETNNLKNILEKYEFTNRKPITKSILIWWTYTNDNQNLLDLNTKFEIEHIFSRNRQEKEKTLKDDSNIESLGNKVLLEKKINITASDYHFSDKKKYYEGYTTKGNKRKEGTNIAELLELSKKDDFNKQNIIERKKEIIDKFIGYLQKENLLINS